MTPQDHRVSGIEHSLTSSTRLQAQEAKELQEYAIVQDAAAEEFEEWGQLDAWSPLAMARNFSNLDKRVKDKTRPEQAEKEEQAEEGEKVEFIEKIEGVAEQFEGKNPELQKRSLLALRTRISSQDTPEEILRKVKESYLDVFLADEALDFLLQTADATTREAILKAKEDLNNIYGKEIRAGRNMSIQARAFSTQGLGSPTHLRDLYRELLQNPKDANTLFQEFTTKFPFDKMKSAIDFILHSLGADLKSKGPSISKGELALLFGEARSMQAILGVFRFFRSRMSLIASAFEREGLILPPRINFENLAKVFMKFLQERYPSVDKALLLAQLLGISEELSAKVIIFLQYRDALRQVAPQLFKDERQRQDLLMCFIETIEELDEELDEEEEEEEEEEKK